MHETSKVGKYHKTSQVHGLYAQVYLPCSKVYEMMLSICWWNYRCFMIGLSKYFDLILGNNNAIIFNSKYYRMVLFGLMLFLTITLNLVLSYVEL
jgi:hypothetical protein